VKITWIAETPYNDATPAFRYTDEERAALMTALEYAINKLDDSGIPNSYVHIDALRRVLSTHKSIEAAVTAMRAAQ
jgi:hypothetical protein